MIKVGLSGNRSAGKKSVCKHFKDLSIPVFDADIVLRFIIHHELDVYKDIKLKLSQLFGNSTIDVSPMWVRTKQEIDIVIDCAEKKLFQAYDSFNEKHKDSIYTVFKSSFLFERSWHKKMDYSINVFAPKITRMERLQKISGKKISDISYILRNEIDDLDKNKMSNFVIHSYDFSAKNIKKQVHEIDQYLIDSYIMQKPTIAERHF